MKVAEQRDGEAFQPRRPAPERNFLANDARTVGLDSAASAASAAHARGRRERINFRLVVGRKGNRFGTLSCRIERKIGSASSITRIRKLAIREASPKSETEGSLQFKIAVGSMFRLKTAHPAESWRHQTVGEPTTPFGFATFTLLNTLRAFTPSVRL